MVRAAIFFLNSSSALVAPPLMVRVSEGDATGGADEVGEGRGLPTAGIEVGEGWAVDTGVI